MNVKDKSELREEVAKATLLFDKLYAICMRAGHPSAAAAVTAMRTMLHCWLKMALR